MGIQLPTASLVLGLLLGVYGHGFANGAIYSPTTGIRGLLDRRKANKEPVPEQPPT
jgi:hypothetical protein